MRSRLESKLGESQVENDRLREENAGLRAKLQEVEFGLPDESNDILFHGARSLREQRIQSELQSSTAAISGLRQKIQEMDAQLTDAHDLITQQEGLLRLADADIFVSKIKDQEKLIVELQTQLKRLETSSAASQTLKETLDIEFLQVLKDKELLETRLQRVQEELESTPSRRGPRPRTGAVDLSMYTEDEMSLPNTPMAARNASRVADMANTPAVGEHGDPFSGSIFELASSPLVGSESPPQLPTSAPPAGNDRRAPISPRTPFKMFDELDAPDLSPISSLTPSSRLSLKNRVSETFSSFVPSPGFAPAVRDASSSSSREEEAVPAPVLIEEAHQNGTILQQRAEELPVAEVESRSVAGSARKFDQPSPIRNGLSAGWRAVMLLQEFVILFLLLALYLTSSAAGRLLDGTDSLSVADILRDAMGISIIGGM